MSVSSTGFEYEIKSFTSIEKLNTQHGAIRFFCPHTRAQFEQSSLYNITFGGLQDSALLDFIPKPGTTNNRIICFDALAVGVTANCRRKTIGKPPLCDIDILSLLIHFSWWKSYTKCTQCQAPDYLQSQKFGVSLTNGMARMPQLNNNNGSLKIPPAHRVIYRSRH